MTSPPTSRRQLGGQLVKFAAVGVASTVLNVVLFFGFNLAMGEQIANILALIICTAVNTAANRRFTFGVKTREGATKVQFAESRVAGHHLGVHRRGPSGC